MFGLCDSCIFARTIQAPRSTFLLCERSLREPERYPRYPRVPVGRCSGHTLHAAELPAHRGGAENAE